MNHDCERLRESVMLLPDGLLSESEEAEVRAHLERCAGCQQLHEEGLRLQSRMRELSAPGAPAGFADRVLAQHATAGGGQRRRRLMMGAGVLAAAAVVLVLSQVGGSDPATWDGEEIARAPMSPPEEQRKKLASSPEAKFEKRSGGAADDAITTLEKRRENDGKFAGRKGGPASPGPAGPVDGPGYGSPSETELAGTELVVSRLLAHAPALRSARNVDEVKGIVRGALRVPVPTAGMRSQQMREAAGSRASQQVEAEVGRVNASESIPQQAQVPKEGRALTDEVEKAQSEREFQRVSPARQEALEEVAGEVQPPGLEAGSLPRNEVVSTGGGANKRERGDGLYRQLVASEGARMLKVEWPHDAEGGERLGGAKVDPRREHLDAVAGVDVSILEIPPDQVESWLAGLREQGARLSWVPIPAPPQRPQQENNDERSRWTEADKQSEKEAGKDFQQEPDPERLSEEPPPPWIIVIESVGDSSDR